MKAIICDLCGAMHFLTYTRKMCFCGNVAGNYIKQGQRDNRLAEIRVRDRAKARVIEVSHRVCKGEEQRGDCWVMSWGNPELRVIDEAPAAWRSYPGATAIKPPHRT